MARGEVEVGRYVAVLVGSSTSDSHARSRGAGLPDRDFQRVEPHSMRSYVMRDTTMC